MSKSTISTFQLFEMFPDQETARTYLESRLWPEGPKCPVCGLGERITARAGGFYRCNQCREDFTVRTGTIFERSHVPLHKWIYAMYLLVTARKGISSLQLSKQIGITQKSAWFVLHRLREACGDDLTKLQGIVEIDETYVGGIEKNKHESKKLKAVGEGFPRTRSVPMGFLENCQKLVYISDRRKAMTRSCATAHARAVGKLCERHEGQAAHLQGPDPMKKPQKPPKALDAIVDKVLAYRPKPKTKPAKKRQRVRKRIQKERL